VMYDDIPALYRCVKEKWGTSKWACKKRNLAPQKPVERDMRADGAWDDEMEALPKPPDS
jgi:hypothetical protein